MKFSSLFLLFFTILSWAQAERGPFDQGQGEFEFARFSNEGILLAIDRDARLACSENGQCVLSSVQTNSAGWEVAFNVGEGMNYNNGGGTTIFTGGYGGNPNSCETCNRTHWGLTVTYRRGQCTQQVMVPRSLYFAMNRYIYGLMQETGQTRRGFTPADEAMIMFYTTIMKQASANSCGNNK
jgi:hypothetical protein